MFKITGICDMCKKEETQDDRHFDIGDRNWREVSLNISQYREKKYLFCKDCREKLGLIEAESKPSVQAFKSVEDKLFEVISEIVSSQLDDRS